MNNNSSKSSKEWRKQFSERLFRFALLIIKIASMLPKTPAGFTIASQLIKAGTSIGANFVESQDASSPRDFTQKLRISLREARESLYWLNIIKFSKLLDQPDLNDAIQECNEIVAVLLTSVKSSKLRIR